MNQELKNDLVAVFNELTEIQADFQDLDGQSLTEADVRESINQRVEDCLKWLGKYVSENDVLEDL